MAARPTAVLDDVRVLACTLSDEIRGTASRTEIGRLARVAARCDIVIAHESTADGVGGGRCAELLQRLHATGRFPYSGINVSQDVSAKTGERTRHCVGYASRLRPSRASYRPLPQRFPGGRVLLLQYGRDAGGLLVVTVHSPVRAHHVRSTVRQPRRPVILVGDVEPSGVPSTTDALRRQGRPPAETADRVIVSGAVKLGRVRPLRHTIAGPPPLAVDARLRQR